MTKREIRERAGNQCQACGMTNQEHLAYFGRSLHLHRERPSQGYVEGNLTVFCHCCHQREHGSNEFSLRFRNRAADPTISQVFVTNEMALMLEVLAKQWGLSPRDTAEACIRIAFRRAALDLNTLYTIDTSSALFRYTRHLGAKWPETNNMRKTTQKSLF